MESCKNIVLLGATGSIGQNALRVIRKHSDRLRLIAVSAHSNHHQLADICQEFSVATAALSKPIDGPTDFPEITTVKQGEEALLELASMEEADIVLIATVGASALRSAMAAIEAGKDIALANKELLVLGGSLVIEAAQRKGVRLLPVDSEHNAIFQCLQGHQTEEVEKIILTASGGQFRDLPVAELVNVLPEDAIQHPNWKMGPKITVDSSTMANKGLEIIEAHWLFGIEADRIEVVIHPQSIAHSFVQFRDGNILGQFSPPSMTFPIQQCLLYPERMQAVEPTIDFKQAFKLEFSAPDFARYPCLKMAYQSLRAGETAPIVFNAANEIAVQRFLQNEIPYLAIPHSIDQALDHFGSTPAGSSIEDRLQIDAETRTFCCSLST